MGGMGAHAVRLEEGLRIAVVGDHERNAARTRDCTDHLAEALVGRLDGLHDGQLADVAPTILALLGLDAPSVMTGKNLVPDP